MSTKASRPNWGLVLGLAIGVAIALATSGFGIWFPVSVALGMALGWAIGRKGSLPAEGKPEKSSGKQLAAGS